MSSIDCQTSKISAFVDYHLQPLVKSLTSYVKDTTDFLNKIKDGFQESSSQLHICYMDGR